MWRSLIWLKGHLWCTSNTFQEMWEAWNQKYLFITKRMLRQVYTANKNRQQNIKGREVIKVKKTISFVSLDSLTFLRLMICCLFVFALYTGLYCYLFLETPLKYGYEAQNRQLLMHHRRHLTNSKNNCPIFI